MTATPPSLDEVAIAKLAKVLGPSRAAEELSSALREVGLDAIGSVEDLELVASVLQRRDGFVATVGALLAVETAMRKLRAK